MGDIENRAKSRDDEEQEEGLDIHDKDEKTIVTNNTDSDIPIDRGWAWVILGASMFMLFLIGGQRKNVGLLFVAYQSRFQSSAYTTSMIMTIQGLVSSFLALFNMTIGMKLISPRVSVMIGGVFFALSFLVSAFANDIRVLFFSSGILQAFGFSMTFAPMLSVIAVYFNKRRGLANSLTLSGASLGGFVFAPILTTMFENYGYTGTMVIVAGLLLHIMLAGALMRPTSFWTKLAQNARCDVDTEEAESLLQTGNMALDETDPSRAKSISESIEYVKMRTEELAKNGSQNGSVKSLTVVNGNGVLRPYPPNLRLGTSSVIPRERAYSLGSSARPRTVSQSSSHLLHNVLQSVSQSNVAVLASCNELYDSVMVLNDKEESDSKLSDNCNQEHKSRNFCCINACSRVKKVLSIAFDVHLLCNPVFLFYLVMAFLMVPGCVYSFVILAPHSKDVGLTSGQTGMLMSVVSSVDLVARILVGIIVDKQWLKKTTILAVSAAVIASASHLVRFLTTFEWLLVYAVLAGMCCGLYMALYSTILVDLLTLARLKSSLGFAILCHGLSGSLFFAIIECFVYHTSQTKKRYPLQDHIQNEDERSLRDSTGSYLVPFHMLGALLYAGAAMALGLPYIHKWHENRHKKKQVE